MASAPNSAKLKDLWTDSAEYRNCYQTSDDIENALRLLELESAGGLVDIGCGNGAFAIAAAKRYPACQVWAFDALGSAVAECSVRAADLLCSNLSVDVAMADSIPLADACADRALLRSVLHHIAEPHPVFEEIARLLKTDGRLVLQAPCNYWEADFSDVLSNVMMLMDDTHRRFFYQPAVVVAGLKQAGFRVGEPECWTYSFPFLDDSQAELVRQHQAEQRLQLRAIDAGKWSIDNYWLRVTATKRAA